jgi:hypothetical protein
VYHSDEEAARWRLADLERDHDRMLARWDELARKLDWSERRRRRQHEAMRQRRLCEGADLARQIDQAEVAIEELRLVNLAFEAAIERESAGGPLANPTMATKAAFVGAAALLAVALTAWPVVTGYGVCAVLTGTAGTYLASVVRQHIGRRRGQRALAAGAAMPAALLEPADLRVEVVSIACDDGRTASATVHVPATVTDATVVEAQWRAALAHGEKWTVASAAGEVLDDCLRTMIGRFRRDEAHALPAAELAERLLERAALPLAEIGLSMTAAPRVDWQLVAGSDRPIRPADDRPVPPPREEPEEAIAGPETSAVAG